MKIALCISGELRTFLSNEVLNSYRNLCDTLNADIFISTWKHVGVSNCHRGDVSVDYEEHINEDQLKNSLDNIISVQIEDYSIWRECLDKSFSDIINRNDMDFRTKNSCSQLYKIYKCNELKKQHELENDFVYDVVVRCRPDFLFRPNFSPTIESNKIYHINSGIAYYSNRVYDVLFYGDSVSMDKLTAAYKYFEELVYNSFSNGLDQRDCCRILKACCVKENLEVIDGPIFGDVWR